MAYNGQWYGQKGWPGELSFWLTK